LSFANVKISQLETRSRKQISGFLSGAPVQINNLKHINFDLPLARNSLSVPFSLSCISIGSSLQGEYLRTGERSKSKRAIIKHSGGWKKRIRARFVMMEKLRNAINAAHPSPN